MSHGDLHDENILLDASGTYYLIDFEFSRYRSYQYDLLFYDYQGDILKSPLCHPYPLLSIYVFLFERLNLILDIHYILLKDYSIEIKSLVKHINHLTALFLSSE